MNFLFCQNALVLILLLAGARSECSVGKSPHTRQSFGRIECPPPPQGGNALKQHASIRDVYYGGGFVCGLTCTDGACDSSPAWRPELVNAFKCKCPAHGCNADGPITGYEENGDQYPLCDKVEGCNCQFRGTKQPYQCYHCRMQPGNWSVYYGCCPKI